MKYCTLPLLACVFALIFVNQSKAVIINGGVTTGDGTFVKLSPGFTDSDPDNTVGKNNFQSPNLFGFDEDQNVSIAAPGLTPDVGPFLSTGTTVASHYVFYDPRFTARQIGFVLFDADILAILRTTQKLAETDYLANTGITYENPSLRGLEAGDSVSINASNQKRLDINWSAGNPGDYVRILTARSPIADQENKSNAVPDTSNSFILLFITAFYILSFQRFFKVNSVKRRLGQN